MDEPHRGVAMTSFVLDRYAAFGGPAVLGYPKGARVTGLRDGGWIQLFEKGCITDSASTSTQAVHGYRWTMWVASGREGGPLRYPVAGLEVLPGRRLDPALPEGLHRLQPRDAARHRAQLRVAGLAGGGRETGCLGFPTGDRVVIPGGYCAGASSGGGIWGLDGGRAYAVHGAVLDAWEAAGGPGGSYGFPTAHTVDNGDGRLTGTFEGGTITA